MDVAFITKGKYEKCVAYKILVGQHVGEMSRRRKEKNNKRGLKQV